MTDSQKLRITILEAMGCLIQAMEAALVHREKGERLEMLDMIGEQISTMVCDIAVEDEEEYEDQEAVL